MNNLGIISPAMMKLFKSCPLKFYFKYIENISIPTLDRSFVVGKNIHALASYFLQKFDVSNFLSELSDKEKDYFNYLKENKYLSYDVLGIEKSISLRIQDFWIGGRIDAIVKNKNDLFILDYKTGGVLSDMTYDFQTMVYMLICDEFFKKYSSLSFVYLDVKNKKESIINFNNELKLEYTQKILDICEKMINFNKLKFKKECNIACEYSKLCLNC